MSSLYSNTLSSYAIGDRVEKLPLLVIDPREAITKNNNPYFRCRLRDSSQELDAIWFDVSVELDQLCQKLKEFGYAEVDGIVDSFNGKRQFKIHSLHPREPDPKELAGLLPTSDNDINHMYSRICKEVKKIKDPEITALLDCYLEDEDLMKMFRMAPAAMKNHHAWIGGLLEHTLELLDLADSMLKVFPSLNADIVRMGLFLHDMAKIKELRWTRSFEYTEDGNLHGHLVMGAIWLDRKASEAAERLGVEKFPCEVIRHLTHIIVSHHGKLEWGAAKTPATPEAIFVSSLDDLAAKTRIALDCRNNADKELIYSERIWALDNKSIYLRQPNEIIE